MSQGNVELAKRGIDAFNTRDLDLVDELAHPDYEFFPALVGTIDGDSFKGREGLKRYFETVSDTWEELRLVGEEFRDLGNRVLWLGRLEGCGRGSGVPVDSPCAFIIELRARKIERVRAYLDHGEALRAAGLAEEGG